MKNNLKMIPIMIYPYIYMIALFLYGFSYSMLEKSDMGPSIGFMALLATAVICNLYSLIVVIVNIVQANKGKYPAKDLAFLNMLIKIVHIPAYIVHFIMGTIGLLASVWGIGFILWALFIDLVTIFLSGMVTVSAAAAASKQKHISSGAAVLYAFMGFIFCIDLISAIIYFIIIKNKSNKLISK